MNRPQLTRADALNIFSALLGVYQVRRIAVDAGDDDTFVWSAEVLLTDGWRLATFDDHYPEDAAIDWAS